MDTKFPYLGLTPVPSTRSMYCSPDLVLNKVTDFPSKFEEVDTTGSVDWGIVTTPSMSAIAELGLTRVGIAIRAAALWMACLRFTLGRQDDLSS